MKVLVSQIFDFSNFSVGYTSRPINMQIFKFPPLLEVTWNFDVLVSQSVSEANAPIKKIY